MNACTAGAQICFLSKAWELRNRLRRKQSMVLQNQAAATKAYAMTDACHEGSKALVLLLYEVPQLPTEL